MKLLLILVALCGMALSSKMKDAGLTTDCDVKDYPLAKMSKNQCVRVTCNKQGEDTTYGVITCPSMSYVRKGEETEWKVVTDKSAPYPDCCPKMVPSVTDKEIKTTKSPPVKDN